MPTKHLLKAMSAATYRGVGGLRTMPKRAALALVSLFAALGTLFFLLDSFWGLAACGLAIISSASGLVRCMNGLWRFKVGFIVSVFIAACLVLWPTAHIMSAGRIGIPHYLVARIVSGSPPTPIVLEVAPDVDLDAIRGAVKGGLYGSAAIVALLTFRYGHQGLVCGVTVLFSLLLQMALRAKLGAVITLSTLASLMVVIGMSFGIVILINERILQERGAGQSITTAVDVAYSHAWSSIVDASITTFIFGFVLLALVNNDEVRGAAGTLLLGVLCSLFACFFCTRPAFEWWVHDRDQ